MPSPEISAAAQPTPSPNISTQPKTSAKPEEKIYERVYPRPAAGADPSKKGVSKFREEFDPAEPRVLTKRGQRVLKEMEKAQKKGRSCMSHFTIPTWFWDSSESLPKTAPKVEPKVTLPSNLIKPPSNQVIKPPPNLMKPLPPLPLPSPPPAAVIRDRRAAARPLRRSEDRFFQIEGLASNVSLRQYPVSDEELYSGPEPLRGRALVRRQRAQPQRQTQVVGSGTHNARSRTWGAMKTVFSTSLAQLASPVSCVPVASALVERWNSMGMSRGGLFAGSPLSTLASESTISLSSPLQVSHHEYAQSAQIPQSTRPVVVDVRSLTSSHDLPALTGSPGIISCPHAKERVDVDAETGDIADVPPLLRLPSPDTSRLRFSRLSWFEADEELDISNDEQQNAAPSPSWHPVGEEDDTSTYERNLQIASPSPSPEGCSYPEITNPYAIGSTQLNLLSQEYRPSKCLRPTAYQDPSKSDWEIVGYMQETYRKAYFYFPQDSADPDNHLHANKPLHCSIINTIRALKPDAREDKEEADREHSDYECIQSSVPGIGEYMRDVTEREGRARILAWENSVLPEMRVEEEWVVYEDDVLQTVEIARQRFEEINYEEPEASSEYQFRDFYKLRTGNPF
ncbi:hypothetical protein IQ07DRAFT_674558 [Pyrenochaeta sp. DS3sAY3a]|nr:hypothetical protein IQ07DRAFT_674558 [Pyrenochaeta sp. DS3sAY3a]